MAASEAMYGSDQTGLICGFLFRHGAPGRPLDSHQAQEWLAREALRPDGSFAWLHLNLATAGAERWLHEHARLPASFHEAAHEGSRSTRIELDGGTLVAVLNDVTFDFAFEPSDVSTLWLAVRHDVVISARRQPLRAVDRLRAAVKDGASIATPAALLLHLLRDQGDELVRVVRVATERIDELEDELLAGRVPERSAMMGRLRRLMVRLQRLLAPEPTALFRLLGRPPAWMSPDDAQALRQSSEEFEVILRDVATLQERIKLLQEEAAARIGEDNARSLFVLTIVTVLALPINLIAGLFGMNVGGIPLNDHPHGFLLIMSLVAAFTVGAGWIAWRRIRRER